MDGCAHLRGWCLRFAQRLGCEHANARRVRILRGLSESALHLREKVLPHLGYDIVQQKLGDDILFHHTLALETGYVA